MVWWSRSRAATKPTVKKHPEDPEEQIAAEEEADGGDDGGEEEEGENEGGTDGVAARFAEKEFGGESDDSVERQLGMFIHTGFAEERGGEGGERVFLVEEEGNPDQQDDDRAGGEGDEGLNSGAAAQAEGSVDG